MNKIKTIIGGGIVATALAVGSIAGAAVDFDPATGTGFSGKGDVQLAFGWNNKQLNTNASDVSFRYVESTVKVQDCVHRYRGTITRRVEDVETTRGVSSAIGYEVRNNKKGDITGFHLTGLGTSSSLSSGGCEVDEQPNGPAQETTVAELQAVHSGVAVGIWTPPVAE